jgi:hypothetical protein
MLNACLTFSRPNKVLFDRKASDIIRFGPGCTRVRVLVLKGYDRGTKSEPKGRQRLIPGSRVVPGYCGPSLSRDVYRDSVIGDL